MDEVGAVEGTPGVSGFPEVQTDELAAYINQVKREFACEAEELLEMFNLSHLRVRC
jgi:hypothetical protein